MAKEKKINSSCFENLKEKYLEENSLGKKLSKEYNLPKLVGTEKQKFLAEAIRSRWINLYKDMLEEDKDNKKELLKILKSVVSSNFYIKKINYKEKGILNIKLDSEEISWKEISKEKSELGMNCAIYFFRKNKKYILKYEIGRASCRERV